MSETLTAPAPLPQQDAPDQDAQLGDAQQSQFTDEELKKQLNVGLLDVSSGIDPSARDRGDAHINEKTRTLSPDERPEGRAARIWEGTKGLGRRIWYGNIARDYIRTRTVQKSRSEIVAQENLGLYKGVSKQDYDQEMEAVVNRFTKDYVHEEVGESKHALGETEQGVTAEQAIKTLISSYASGAIGHEELVDRKKRLVAELGSSLQAEDRKKGILFADNILSVAQNARVAFEHNVALDRIESFVHAYGGEAKVGVRTEARRDATDKIMDSIYKTRPGAALVNETAIAAVAATAITVSKFASRKALTLALAPISLGASTAVVAGLRERLHVGQDRQTHTREMAEGGEIDVHNSKRRDRYEATRYNTVSAHEVTNSMAAATELLNADSSTFSAALETLLSAHTRSLMSDRENMDLLDYSGAASLEQERFAFDDTKAGLKEASQRVLSELDDAALAAAGLTSRDIVEVLRERSADVEATLRQDITAKDAVFNSLRRRQVGKMAVCAFVGGETLGLVAQEIRAEFSDQVQGVFENNSDAATRRTLLAGIFHRGTGHGVIGAEHGAGQAVNGHTNVALPPGYHLTEAKDGAWNLTQGHDKVIGQVGFDKAGHLNEASKQLLEQKGYILSDHTDVTTASHTVSETVQRTPADYINQHPDKFTTVNRQVWYANDTPAPNFDKNELDLWWGGQNNTGINAQGDYVYNVAHMTPGGSYEGGLSANAMELAKEGKLSVALSLTQGTQSHVFMVRVNTNGDAVFSHNNPLVQSFFENQNGHAKFDGAYAEVVQNTGVNPNGSENVNILATYGGTNDPRPVTDVLHHVVTTHGEHVYNTIAAPAEAGTPSEIPFVIPVAGRRGLEKLQPEVYGYGYGYNYGYGQTAEYWKRWNKEKSPRLRRNPDADLDTGEELAWYQSEQRRIRGASYLSEINRYLDDNETLKGIGDETKAVVCIPVAAANEADNIYRTLSMFARQDEDARQSSLILLNVNWKQSLESDPDQMQKIQQTQDEIARAQRDFPELRIASFNKVWSDDFVRSKRGKIYGEVIKVLYDTAAFAMDKSVKEGRRQSANEALLITNDADTLGMGRNYLRNYIRALERDRKADVFSATIRRGVQSYKDFPGYGVASEFYAILNMMTQRQQKTGNGGFTTEGPNSGIRMSMYAAIGGCEDRVGAGADAVLGQRIAAARRERTAPTGWRRLRVGTRQPQASGRKIGHYVGGAQIDTLPDRLLGAYRQGKWIARGWDGFDNGGYEGRGVSMAAGTLDREDPETEMDAIAKRIEVSVAGFASNWYRDPAVISSALAMCFGVNTDDDKLYEYEWDWSKSGDGAFKFAFTENGKRTLQNRLLRDRRGQFDPFSNRLGRQLYNVTSPGAAKQPLLANPRMLT